MYKELKFPMYPSSEYNSTSGKVRIVTMRGLRSMTIADKPTSEIVTDDFDSFQSDLNEVRDLMYQLCAIYPNTIQPSYRVLKARNDGIITEEEFNKINHYYWYL